MDFVQFLETCEFRVICQIALFFISTNRTRTMIVKIENLSKVFKDGEKQVVALQDASLEIKSGATALLGPNGSGKSTLIKIILGLVEPTAGKFILFPEHDMSHRESLLKIGYMPETPSLISGVNAVKFIRHIGMLSGLNYNTAMQRTHEVLDYVGIFEERYREIRGYSTGMKQRILFAQALVHDPEFLILDEPTTGLSPEGRSEMLDLITEITKDYGKSIMFSTHILPDVEDICNNVIILYNGKVLFQGGTAEMLNKMRKGKRIVVSSNVEQIKSQLMANGYEIENDWRQENSFFLRSPDENPIEFSEIREVVQANQSYLIAFEEEQVSLENLFVERIRREREE